MNAEYRSKFSQAARNDGSLIERVITEFYKQFAQTWAKGRLAVDAGAHSGYHTFRLAEVKMIKKVIAIEANDRTYKNLKKNWNNSPFKPKVRLVSAAVQGNEDLTEISFQCSPTHPGRSGINPVLINANNTKFDQPVAVPATTIDKLVSDNALPCGFIKLDLEGGEFNALSGAVKTLSKDKPVCVFENGADSPQMNGYTVEDQFKLFQDAEMDFVTVYGDVSDRSTVDEFWYAWAFPKSQMDECRAILNRSMIEVFPNT